MIEKETVVRLGELSLLSLTEEEITALTKDLGAIVEYISALSAVSVADKAHDPHAPVNVMRPDEVTNPAGQFHTDLLENAPRHTHTHIVVKKILP